MSDPRRSMTAILNANRSIKERFQPWCKKDKQRGSLGYAGLLLSSGKPLRWKCRARVKAGVSRAAPARVDAPYPFANSVVKKRSRHSLGGRDPRCPAFGKPGMYLPSRGEGMGRGECNGSHTQETIWGYFR